MNDTELRDASDAVERAEYAVAMLRQRVASHPRDYQLREKLSAAEATARQAARRWQHASARSAASLDADIHAAHDAMEAERRRQCRAD